ncbi:MAG: YceD family protein [Anaerolineales bacterium]
MNTSHRPLRLNIGFLIGQPIGTNHDFNFDYDEIKLGDDLTLSDFIGTANFSRTPQGLFLQANFQGRLQLECVLCLDMTEQILDMDFTELFAFNNRSVSESGLLVPENGIIDLEMIVRDYALLEIPMNPKCKPDCRGLCPECGQNLNEKDCGHTSEIASSPFSSLKSLLKDQTE